MIVGQRNIDETNFSLHQMPAPPRDKNAKEKSKRFSATEVGWDSHNSIIMAVDSKAIFTYQGICMLIHLLILGVKSQMISPH